MTRAKRWRTAPGAFLVCFIAIAGCRQTIYQPLDAAEPGVPDLDRRVSYQLASDYVRHAPHCAAILVRGAKAGRRIFTAIKGAVERHLATRIPRVMGAAATARTADRLGVDLERPADWRPFVRATGCHAIMSIQLLSVTDSFWGVWASREIGLELSLVRIGISQRDLWVARHTAARSDGGVPLSLISLPFSIGRATLLTSDEEAFHSIADDAVRRMMATLPDIRGAFPADGRGN